MSLNPKEEQNNEYKKKFIERVKDLHDDDKKLEILNQIIKISKEKKQININKLSENLNYEFNRLTAFLEELILTGKINAIKKADVIEFL